MNLKNLIKLELLSLCIGVIDGDFIVLLVRMGGFTMFGLGTFFTTALVADFLISDFEQQKSIRQYRPKHANTSRCK